MSTPAPDNSTLMGHPKGLFLLFTVEMWERMSYYGMRALLVLYMTEKTTIANPGLGWSTGDALGVYAWYTGLVYATPMLGGFLADKFIGKRRAVYIGGVVMMIGHFLMAIENMGAFYTALTCLIIGNGFFKPNISTMVGGLYEEGDTRRDSAFTIFYMGINLGAVLGGVICGTMGENVGFHYGFAAAGVGMALGLVSFYFFEKKLIPDHVGNNPEPDASDASNSHEPFTKEEVQRISVILVLATFTMFFWAAFEQAGGLMNIYTYQKVDRHFMGIEVPASAFQSVNPAIIFLFAPLFSMLWTYLGKKGWVPSTPIKMGIGLILLSFGFVFMLHAVNEADAGMSGKAALFWIVGAYFWHTMGELCLSPIGLSMVTKMAPARIVSLMMGVWFGSNFIANLVAGQVGAYSEKLGEFPLFTGIIFATAGAGMVLFLVSAPLVRWMHQEDEMLWGWPAVIGMVVVCGVFFFAYPSMKKAERVEPDFMCSYDQREAKANLNRVFDAQKTYFDGKEKDAKQTREKYALSIEELGFVADAELIEFGQIEAKSHMKGIHDKLKALKKEERASATMASLKQEEKEGEYTFSIKLNGDEKWVITAKRTGDDKGLDGRDLKGDTWTMNEKGEVRNVTGMLYRYRQIVSQEDKYVVEAKRLPGKGGLEGDTWQIDEAGNLRNITGGCGAHVVPPPEAPPVKAALDAAGKEAADALGEAADALGEAAKATGDAAAALVDGAVKAVDAANTDAEAAEKSGDAAANTDVEGAAKAADDAKVEGTIGETQVKALQKSFAGCDKPCAKRALHQFENSEEGVPNSAMNSLQACVAQCAQ
ncbi:MAG: peptide MFS transporter [Deltaproteobacteria bacterium]|nr:peptide MFS transporter [Deltaproteobacteria bacterium]